MCTSTDESYIRLTLRQRQILCGVVNGESNKRIASRLGIKVVTVKLHMGVLFRKLRVSNRTHAATVALTSGLLADSDLSSLHRQLLR